jgi:O-antigen ligase
MATAALILGILGVLGGLIPFLFLPVLCLGVLGFVLGLIARGRRKRARASTGMATWGVVLSVLAIALGVFGMVTVFGAVDELDRDLEQLEQDMEDDMSDLTTPEGD